MKTYTSKTEFLKDFIKLNPDYEQYMLDINNPENSNYNFNFIKQNNKIDSEGNRIDWDGIIDEPGFIDSFSYGMSTSFNDLTRNALAYGSDALSFGLDKLGYEDTADKLDAYAENALEEGRKYKEELMNDPIYAGIVNWQQENPNAGFTSDPVQVGNMLGSGITSLAATFTGAITATLGAKVIGLGTVATGVAGIFGTGLSAFGMEAGSEYAEMANFYATDREVSTESYQKHLNKFKNTKEYKNANFTNQKKMEAKFISDNYKIDNENNVITKLGVTDDEARTIALASGTAYGFTSATLEMTLGKVGNRFMGILKPSKGNPFKNSIKNVLGDKYATKMSFIPKGTAVNRLLKDSVDEVTGELKAGTVKTVGRFLSAGAAEGATESLQLLAQTRISRLIEGEREEASLSDYLQAFQAGGMIGSGVTGVRSLSKIPAIKHNSIIQMGKNQISINKKLQNNEQLFYYKRDPQDKTKFAIGSRVKLLNNEDGSYNEVSALFNSEELDGNSGLFDRVNTRKEAQVAVRKLEAEVRKAAIKENLSLNQDIIDGSAVISNKDGKSVVKILNKDGNTVKEIPVSNRKEARKISRQIDSNIKDVNNLNTKYPKIAKEVAAETQAAQETQTPDEILVMQDFVKVQSPESGSKDAARLNQILPPELTEEERVRESIKIITKLNQKDVESYIDNIPQEENITYESFVSDLLEDANDLDIEIDKNNIFTGEVKIEQPIDTDATIEQDAQDDIDIEFTEPNQVDEVKFKSKGLLDRKKTKVETVEDVPTPKDIDTPQQTLDFVKEDEVDVDALELTDDLKNIPANNFKTKDQGGTIEDIPTSTLKGVLKYRSKLYGKGIESNQVKLRINKELKKREEQDTEKFSIDKNVTRDEANNIDKSLIDFSKFMFNKFKDTKGKPAFNVNIVKNKKFYGGVYIPTTKTIEVNLTYATEDVPFHEFIHPFIEQLRLKNPQAFKSVYNSLFSLDPARAKRILAKIKKNYKELKSYERKDIFEEEVITTAIGEIATTIYKNNQKSNPLYQWLVDTYNAIKKFVFGPDIKRVEDLTPLSTMKDVAEIIAGENIIELDVDNIGSSLDKALSEMALYSITSPASVFKMQVKRLVNKVYRDATRFARKNNISMSPYDFKALTSDLTKNPDALDIIDEWFASKFKDHPDVVNAIPTETNETTNNKFVDEIKEFEADGEEFFLQGLREGLAEILPTDQDFQGVINQEVQFYNRLGILASESEIKKLTALAYKSVDYPAFETEMNKMFRGLFTSPEEKGGLKAFYLLKQNTLRMNRNNRADNQRINYQHIATKNVIDNSTTITIKRVGEVSNDGSKDNQQQDRNTLLERNIGEQILHYLTFKNFEFKEVDESDPNNPTIKYSPSYFKNVNVNDLIKSNLALISTRGDSPTYFLAEIKETHKEAAKDIFNKGRLNLLKTGYWKEQIDNVLIDKESVLNYTEEFTEEMIAHEIAVHEAMSKILPQYYTFKSEELFKRIKIPTTQVTVSDEMPNYTVEVFRIDKATFVYNDNNINATQNIRGVDVKYIGDGGSLSSSSFMKKMSKAFGTKKLSVAKTVIYANDRAKHDIPSKDDGVVMIKHNQFLPEKGVKIFYDKGLPTERLFAEIDESGNIQVYDKEGNKSPRDMLLTTDEAKIITGNYANDIKKQGFVTLPGNSLGFIKTHKKAPSFARHLMQWYNHIYDENVINVFKNNIFEAVKLNLRRDVNSLFIQSPTNNVVEKIKREFLRYDKIDTEAFFSSAIEHSKNGAGLHISQLPTLKRVIRKNYIEKNIKLAKMEGTKSDVVPNIRGDLKDGEIAISIQNAKALIQQVKLQEGDSNYNNSTNAGKLQLINNFLNNNEVFALVSRSPVPHAGGVMMARIKRVHMLENQVIMHHNDVFQKLEGDSDGDSVQIEFLNQDMTTEYKKFFDNLNVEGIDLGKYKRRAGGANLKFTKISDRIKSIREIKAGSTAIGQIANLQTKYGILYNTIDSISIDGQEVFLREPNDYVTIGLINEEFSTAMRYLLQAAVDNSKYMMIESIGFASQDNMKAGEYVTSKFFKTADNQDVSPDIALKLHKLFESRELFKNVHSILNLGNYDGQFSIEEMYDYSRLYNEFTKNKETITNNKAIEMNINASIKYKKDSEGNFIMHPKEMLAIALDETKQSYELARDTKSEEIGPWDMNMHVHTNAHIDAVNLLTNKYVSNLFEAAAKKDGVNTAQHFDKSRNEAADYADGLIKELKFYFGRKVNITQLDSNKNYQDIQSKYHEKYSKLSEVAKVYATLMYLGADSLIAQSLASKIMPAASKEKGKFNLLDYKTLNKYFKEYNNVILNPNLRSFSRSARSIETIRHQEIIKEVCNV